MSRLRVHQIDDEGLADGSYALEVSGGVVSLVAAAAPFNPLVTVVGGVPGLVFDDDGQIVYMES